MPVLLNWTLSLKESVSVLEQIPLESNIQNLWLWHTHFLNKERGCIQQNIVNSRNF
jgi:hypothetical protein